MSTRIKPLIKASTALQVKESQRQAKRAKSIRHPKDRDNLLYRMSNNRNSSCCQKITVTQD